MTAADWPTIAGNAAALVAGALAWWRLEVRRRRRMRGPIRVWLVWQRPDGSTDPPRPCWLHFIDPHTDPGLALLLPHSAHGGSSD